MRYCYLIKPHLFGNVHIRKFKQLIPAVKRFFVRIGNAFLVQRVFIEINYVGNAAALKIQNLTAIFTSSALFNLFEIYLNDADAPNVLSKPAFMRSYVPAATAIIIKRQPVNNRNSVILPIVLITSVKLLFLYFFTLCLPF